MDSSSNPGANRMRRVVLHAFARQWHVYCQSLMCCALTASSVRASVTPTGDVSPDPSTTTAQDNLYIGNNADGALSVDGGDDIFSNYGYIGQVQGVHGDVAIDGAGSSWILTRALTIGLQGTGRLAVTGGALVETGVVRIGFESTQSSEAIVSGASSRLIAGGLQFWDTGPVAGGGSLRVEDGAYFSSQGNIRVRSSPGGAGSHITIDGSGSRWEHTRGPLNIEFGSVLVVNGGELDITGSGFDARIFVGDVLTVSGTGSTITTDDQLFLRGDYRARLNIGSGAHVLTALDTIAGYWSDTEDPVELGQINFDGGTLTTRTLMAGADQLIGVGTVNTKGLVTDTELVFNLTRGNQQQLLVNSLPGQQVTINLDMDGTGILGAGYRGPGATTIENGFVAKSIEGYVGYQSSADGLATVVGSGSRWDVTHELVVGERGEGSLNVVDQAVVTAKHLNVGMQESSVGTVTLAGAGSKIEADSARVGVLGEALLHVRDGATLQTLFGTIGSSLYNGPERSALYHAEVIVEGTDSRWDNTGALNIAHEGHGKLTLSDGGIVNTAGGTRIGHKQGSIAEIQVVGEGSGWYVAGEMGIGYRGQADLKILSGGRIESGRVSTSSGPGEVDITVQGEDSEWAINGDLYFNGDGRIRVLEGAKVSAVSADFSFIYAAEPGRIEVRGPGSEFLIAGLFEFDRPLTLAGGGSIRSGEVELNSDIDIEGSQSHFQIQGGMLMGYRIASVINQNEGLVEVMNGRLVLGKEQAPQPANNPAAPVQRCLCGDPFLGDGTYNLTGGMLDMHGNDVVLGLGNAVLNYTGGELRNVGTLVNLGGELTSTNTAFTIGLDGNYVQHAEGILTIELGGATPGEDHDVLEVAGDAELGGTLSLVLVDGYAPALNKTFTVLTSGGLNGSRFDVVAGNPYASGLMFVATYTGTDVRVTTMKVGDADSDGDIDGFDLALFFGSFTGPNQGPPVISHTDVDGDGDVDGVDLGHAYSAFTGPLAPTNVPEPASLMLLGIGGLLISRRPF